MRIIMAFAAVLSAVAFLVGGMSLCQANLIDAASPSAAPKFAVGNGAVFPNVVPDLYATMDEVARRQQTCMDQYIMNAATGSNAKLSWEQYYDRCDQKLIR
jgi:hypothetical protein